jgi:hypothetical protein
MSTTTIVIVVIFTVITISATLYFLFNKADDSQLKPLWTSSKWKSGGDNPITLTMFTLGGTSEIHLDYSRPGVMDGASIQNVASGVGLYEIKNFSGLNWTMARVTGSKTLDCAVSADKQTMTVKDDNKDKMSINLTGTYTRST